MKQQSTAIQCVGVFAACVTLGLAFDCIMPSGKPARPVPSGLSESEKSQQRFTIKRRWEQYYAIKYPDWSPWLREHTAAVDALAEIRQKGLE